MNETTTATYPNLKAWRAANNLTQQEAADFIGVSQSHYRDLELQYRTPRAGLAKRIIDKTGVPLESLTGAA